MWMNKNLIKTTDGEFITLQNDAVNLFWIELCRLRI